MKKFLKILALLTFAALASSRLSHAELILEPERLELTVNTIHQIPVPGLRRFTVTDPTVLAAELLPGEILKITPLAQGRTILYLWLSGGKRILDVEVKIGGLDFYRGLEDFNPLGAKFLYRFRVGDQRIPKVGWRAPIYDHEFQAQQPFSGRREWKTILRAVTNPRLEEAPGAAPFSQATEPTYLLSYYRTPKWTLAAGDVPFFSDELSVQGFSLRGGHFAFQDTKRALQVYGGWAKPNFGREEFYEIPREKLFGARFQQELWPSVTAYGSVNAVQQEGATGFEGRVFHDDVVGVAGVRAQPLTEALSLEAEYGRNKHDNAFRTAFEYRPYWGRLFAQYRRTGQDYLQLSRGFILNGYQEAIVSGYLQPTRRLNFDFAYYFSQLVNPLELEFSTTTQHSGYAGARYKPSLEVDYSAVLRLTYSGDQSSSQSLERGSLIYQRNSIDNGNQLFAEVYGQHRSFAFAQGLNEFDGVGGGNDFRYRRYLKKNLLIDLFNRNEFEQIRQSTLSSLDDYFRAQIQYGPVLQYFWPFASVGGGFDHQLLFTGLESQRENRIQPFVQGLLNPSQAFEVSATGQWGYDIQRQQSYINVRGEVMYRFGPGIPKGIFSGFAQQAKVSGLIYIDKNDDGVWDEGDERLDALPVLINEKTSLKSANGDFSTSLKPGQYQIAFEVPEHLKSYALGCANPGDYALSPGQKLYLDCGFSQSMLLQGKIAWNGATESESSYAIPALTVKIRAPDGTEFSTQALQGRFQLRVKQAGTYRAELANLPVGYSVVGDGAPNATVALNEVGNFEPILVQAERAVVGRVFLDDNGNGAFDEGEKALPHVRIELGQHQVFSGADGGYLFSDLAAGHYPVRITPAKVPGYQAPGLAPVIFNQDGGKLELLVPFRKAATAPIKAP